MPAGRGPDQHPDRTAAPPGVEAAAVIGRGQGPAAGGDGRARRLAADQPPGQQLQEDLRLAVAAHGAEHARQAAVGPGDGGRATGCGPGAGPAGTRPDGPARARSRCPGCAGRSATPGTTRWDPKPAALDCTTHTPSRSASTAVRAMVPPGCVACRPARPPGPDRWRPAGAARRSGSTRAAPSAPSCSTARRSWPAWRAASISEVGPGRVVGIGGQVEPRRDPGAGQGQVALRVGRHGPDAVAEAVGPERGAPSRPGSCSRSLGANSPRSEAQQALAELAQVEAGPAPLGDLGEGPGHARPAHGRPRRRSWWGSRPRRAGGPPWRPPRPGWVTPGSRPHA